MTASHPADIRQTAAEAALAVSGVLALQPTLASRLTRNCRRGSQQVRLAAVGHPCRP